MFQNIRLQNLTEYLTTLDKRTANGVFFYRLNCYSENIKQFILKYYQVAIKNGVVIDGKIPNPNENNLSYYEEIMGLDFQLSVGFIDNRLEKWLPRLNATQRKNISEAMYDVLFDMQKNGKNLNMIKNAYIKFMCWFYYKFEKILHNLGKNDLPKVLYDGDIGGYELKLMSILSKAGCDILLLQRSGDSKYIQLDPKSDISFEYLEGGATAFPADFSIANIRKEIEELENKRRIYGDTNVTANCTNAWITGKWKDDVLTPSVKRGSDSRFFYNVFVRINGVEDKAFYENELFNFQAEIKAEKRNLLIIDNSINAPNVDEINAIKRQNYSDITQMIISLSANLKAGFNSELQKIVIKAFIDVMTEESQQNQSINKLMNKAVYILCWVKRYQNDLFKNYEKNNIPVFIYFGGCQNTTEALFIKLLSKLPVDVLIFVPNLNKRCIIQDKFLYEINYDNSLVLEKYPSGQGDTKIGTVAYHAERELDDIMYQNSGIYREKQYNNAMAVTLKTMYEEISILWPQELKYRTGFSTIDNRVNMPVIFAKVSGVKDGDVRAYWNSIRDLIDTDTLVVKNMPIYASSMDNPIKPYAVEFFNLRGVAKNKIKQHKVYQYGFIREDMQDYILDKLQLLIESKLIKGTFENGTEYTIVSTILNLNTNIIRMIQKFDFTKKNPKIIYINTTERVITLEESIVIAFLNLIGFDILIFIPTGYRNVEKFFNGDIFEEHQIGEYLYDLRIPDFESFTEKGHRSWKDKLFGGFY